MSAHRLLLLSLVLNAALAGLVAWAWLEQRATPAPAGAIQHLTNRALRIQVVPREAAPQIVEVMPPFHWREVESTDYRVYLANLRALGCPERAIRDIIVADVDQFFLARLRELLAPLQVRFWEFAARLDDVEEEGKQFEKDFEAIRDARKAVFKELFGDTKPLDFERDAADAEVLERARGAQLLDFLPVETRERLVALDRQHQQARAKLRESDHELSKEERAEREQQERELAADRDRQLAELLSPEELAEYRLRTSQAASWRERPLRVEFSEDELRAIVRLQNERQQLHAQLSGNTPETRQRRAELQQQTEAQLQEALGETRYADYQRANDHRFQQVSQVVERHGLTDDRARTVYEMARTAEAQAAVLRKDAARSPEEQQALLQAIRAETERSVREVLGADAFATWQKHGGASWVDGLSKRAN
jgi:hypothetical protein